MLHARRLGGPVAAAQNCAEVDSWSLVGCDEGQEMYERGTGSMRRFDATAGPVVDEGLSQARGGPSVRHRPPDGEEDAELFGAAGIPPDEAGQAAEAGRVHRHRRRDPRCC